jgi:hypothetical protein
MKTAIIITIIIHGLIHLLGFVKAFSLAEVKELTLSVSKPLGWIWLIGFLLFMITAWLYAVNSPQWWITGWIAILVSQSLIFYFWQDARFGTIANVLILLATIIGFGTWRFNHQFEKEVQANLRKEQTIDHNLLTETDIKELPPPVQQYLRYTGSIGKPKVQNFKISFTGKIRANEQSAWMPFSSEQYNFLKTPTRLFFMNAVMKKLPVAGYHCYKDGTAFMDIRLFSLFKVQYQEGKEMDVAETVTFFNDMCCMAPATLIDDRIIWLETDGNKVKAMFKHKDISITAWLYFNDKGELVNFTSNDRYAADAGNQLPWSTPLKDYRDINGYRLAGNAETIYTYPGGDLTYGTFHLTNIEYNIQTF